VNLSVSVDHRDSFIVVHVDGELDHATAPVLAATLDGQIGAGGAQVIVDLANLNFIDSSGLGILVSRHRALRGRNASLHLAGPPPRIRKILARTGLDLVFDIQDSVQATLDHAHAPR
jgi:anti-anti-sigma factor